MTGLGSVSDMAFSGYARCTKESLAVHSLDHKYARQCALRTKEYGQEVYACNRRRRCGSNPWSSRRTLETCLEVGESPAEDVKWRVLRGNLASFDQSVSTQFDSPSEVARGGQGNPAKGLTKDYIW